MAPAVGHEQRFQFGEFGRGERKIETTNLIAVEIVHRAGSNATIQSFSIR